MNTKKFKLLFVQGKKTDLCYYFGVPVHTHKC